MRLVWMIVVSITISFAQTILTVVPMIQFFVMGPPIASPTSVWWILAPPLVYGSPKRHGIKPRPVKSGLGLGVIWTSHLLHLRPPLRPQDLFVAKLLSFPSLPIHQSSPKSCLDPCPRMRGRSRPNRRALATLCDA